MTLTHNKPINENNQILGIGFLLYNLFSLRFGTGLKAKNEPAEHAMVAMATNHNPRLLIRKSGANMSGANIKKDHKKEKKEPGVNQDCVMRREVMAIMIIAETGQIEVIVCIFVLLMNELKKWS